MRRFARLAPPLVVTFSVLEACKGEAKREPPAPAPPVASTEVALTRPSASVPPPPSPRRRQRHAIPKQPAVEAVWKGKGVDLNPKIASGPHAGEVVLAREEKCFPTREDFDFDTDVEVDCPPEMDDIAWDHCDHRIVLEPSTGNCFCNDRSLGNPPPPTRTPCPSAAARRPPIPSSSAPARED